MQTKLRFKPVSHSWVALHPKPKGVIQFIGGAFFGTFGPMLFYRYLLQILFNQGYTIILLPFNFSFNHYAEAGFLIKEQYEVIPEVVRMAKAADYEHEIYLNDRNFSWMGHSIGCKYVSLLEGFSVLPRERDQLAQTIRAIVDKTSKSSPAHKKERLVQIVVENILGLINELQQKRIDATELINYYTDQEANIYLEIQKNPDIVKRYFTSLFIKDQPSILLAPVNSGTESAIPKFLAKIIDTLGLGVKPTPDETFALIEVTQLFNLLGLTSFKSDNLAKSTCDWFINQFKKPPADFQANLLGGHLKPLGIQIGNYVLNFPYNFSIIQSVQRRNADLESYVIKLLESLQQIHKTK